VGVGVCVWVCVCVCLDNPAPDGLQTVLGLDHTVTSSDPFKVSTLLDCVNPYSTTDIHQESGDLKCTTLVLLTLTKWPEVYTPVLAL
jgi:hypothetical protein